MNRQGDGENSMLRWWRLAAIIGLDWEVLKNEIRGLAIRKGQSVQYCRPKPPSSGRRILNQKEYDYRLEKSGET